MVTRAPRGAVKRRIGCRANRARSRGSPPATIRCIGPVSLPTRMERPAAERDDIAEAGLAGEVARLRARRSAIAAPSGALGRAAEHHRRHAARRRDARRAAAKRSTGQRLAGRCGEPPGTSSRNALRQVEARDVARRPGEIGRRHAVDAGDAQLLGLAVDGVHRGRAPGLACGCEAPRGDARPFRPRPARSDGNRGWSGRRSGDRRPGRSRPRADVAPQAPAAPSGRARPGRSSSQTRSK